MMYFPSLYLIHKATKIPTELTPNPSSIVGGLGTSIVIGPYSVPYSLFNLSLPIPPWVIWALTILTCSAQYHPG